MYPPKNGPRALAKHIGMDEKYLPKIDLHDELTEERVDMCRKRFGETLSQLSAMGYDDQLRNVRSVLRHHGDKDRVVQEYAHDTMIFIGDRVIRGPDWKWGNQDGKDGIAGTVRALRQWHPQDPSNVMTEAVVSWDIGAYGNYRFGYRGAFDLIVVEKCARYTRPSDNAQTLRCISVGDKVKRDKPNWRWGKQDGNTTQSYGTVIELYASPAPFANGIRVGVLWDKDKDHWLKVATEYKERLAKRQKEKEKEKPKEEEKEKEKEKTQQYTQMCQNVTIDPHYTLREIAKTNDNSPDAIENSIWEEPDFDELLSQPLPRYRWGIEEAYDLSVIQQVGLKEGQYLIIDDKVTKGPAFKSPPSGDYSEESGVVLRVEQWDPARVQPQQIRGDKVYTQWSSRHGFRFNYNGIMDVVFSRRGQLLNHESTRIRVGDRVQRSFFWDQQKYGDEDGGDGAQGTVAVLQFVLEISGILAKVRWDKTDHVNMYSWGFNDIYDIAKIE
ncbi:skeletrophin [Reticulomyxa filosa]|uniref:Skeletrophin n=1 Tax=Reticulomyxa filosa TaxID=46433 RepID=X6PCG0_RETFI|nr:skeletrophin [Reticulomyxa filosa]|eukprot:ETO36215.1 skeletrophin [Reticulomyxa filosa]